MKNVLIIAPHPDDETLGVGGTLLKHKSEGHSLNWIIVTNMKQEQGYMHSQISDKEEQIDQVARIYGFDNVVKLNFSTAQLDRAPLQELVQKIGQNISQWKPDIVYVPYPGDAHSDHNIVFKAAAGCSKWFRYPGIKRILAYETISETEFGIRPDEMPFRPNVFINISSYLEQKIDIMKMYQKELGEFPFPRSEKTIRSLARYRGSTAGFEAAESFVLIKEIID